MPKSKLLPFHLDRFTNLTATVVDVNTKWAAGELTRVDAYMVMEAILIQLRAITEDLRNPAYARYNVMYHRLFHEQAADWQTRDAWFDDVAGFILGKHGMMQHRSSPDQVAAMNAVIKRLWDGFDGPSSRA